MTSVTRRSIPLGITVALPLALLLGAPVSAHTRAQPSKASPKVEGIEALASNDVWEVGSYWVRERPVRTLARHWDGQAWTTVATPNPGTGQNELRAVSGTGSDDVWAVGYFDDPPTGHSGPQHLMAVHWDGSAWTTVHVQQPHPPGHHHYTQFLDDVAAIAPDDAWAIGYTTQSYGPFVEHWDGSTWSMVANPDDMAEIIAVSATSSNDAWIVGFNHGGTQPMTWHWNGATWQSVRGPSIEGAEEVHLVDVVAVSPTDAWASGSWEDFSFTEHPLLMHWNGKSWKVQSPPDSPTDWGSLSATSATDVWARGFTNHYPNSGSVIEHWDGTQWSSAALPAQLKNAALGQLSADATDDAWVEGNSGLVTGHWDGNRWRLQQ